LEFSSLSMVDARCGEDLGGRGMGVRTGVVADSAVMDPLLRASIR
jgi:hypothetical protein